MASAKEKLPPPEGTRPMMISMREMETLGLKTGSGLRDTLEHKVFDKADILDQISKVGFMCPFHEFRTDIQAMQGTEILIIADPEEVYGENWLLCLTPKAFETQMDILQQRAREREEAMQSADAAEAEEDTSNLVYEDVPIVAQPWTSDTAKETEADVNSLTMSSSRPLVRMSVTKMSDELNADYKFSDRDADQCFVEWRQHKDPNYDLSRMEQDVGLQGHPQPVDGSTQTAWFRSVNSAVQYEPIVMTPEAREEELENEKVQAFLDKMVPVVEQALQQNETLDVFLDPFANLNDTDSTSTNKNENTIKELRSFTDLVYSKNKALPAIDWHPKKNGVIAVAATANVSFQKRLDLLDKVDNSYVLIWNFGDMIHPQLMLEAPQDVLAVRFNPFQPHLVAGGLSNGQVLVWDLSKAEQMTSRSPVKTPRNTAGGAPEKDEEDEEPKKRLPPVKPLYVSYIDVSHRRPVSDLTWLPISTEVTNRGHFVAMEEDSVHQFMTIAGDGQVAFWDLRFKDPKYRGLTRIKVDKNASKDVAPEVHFTPIYSISLSKVETTGELTLTRMSLENSKDEHTLSTRFYCGTEEGQLLYTDWRPHTGNAKGSNGSRDDGGDGSVEYVQWICRDHARPILHLAVSPFFSSIYLSVSETHVNIWNLAQHKASSEDAESRQRKSNGPIFNSPVSIGTITCAVFSPTRPGVFFVGKSTGTLDVWDFMDQSHQPSLSAPVAACQLTSIEFRHHPSVHQAFSTFGSQRPGQSGAGGTGASSSSIAKQQVVAVGDETGNLHILSIPPSLSRPLGGEKQAMETFFQRESTRATSGKTISSLNQTNVALVEDNEAFQDSSSAVPSQPSGQTSASGGNGEEANAESDAFHHLEDEFCRDLGIEVPSAAS